MTHLAAPLAVVKFGGCIVCYEQMFMRTPDDTIPGVLIRCAWFPSTRRSAPRYRSPARLLSEWEANNGCPLCAWYHPNSYRRSKCLKC
jgi:hypothetical protein